MPKLDIDYYSFQAKNLTPEQFREQMRTVTESLIANAQNLGHARVRITVEGVPGSPSSTPGSDLDEPKPGRSTGYKPGQS